MESILILMVKAKNVAIKVGGHNFIDNNDMFFDTAMEKNSTRKKPNTLEARAWNCLRVKESPTIIFKFNMISVSAEIWISYKLSFLIIQGSHLHAMVQFI